MIGYFFISFISGALLSFFFWKKIGEKKLKNLQKELKREKESFVKKFEKKKEDLLATERILLKRISEIERRENELKKAENELQKKTEEIKKLKEKEIEKLEKISAFSKEEAKNELLKKLEEEEKKEIQEKLEKLEKEKEEVFEEKAKRILSFAIEKCALSQTQELTTTSFPLPTDDLKGKIIGKEGRNIRAFEKLTGVELIVDETPETITISSFNPIRRKIAELALSKLIADGRIQPAKIEEKVKEAEEEIKRKIKEYGEKACHEVGILGLDPKLIELLGKLYFRTSFGQNVLLHSMEVALLAEAIASELKVNSAVAKKAGLLHDIGKALDHKYSGSHTKIGMKILNELGVEKEVIDAMKSHHDEFPVENIEATVVKVADKISGARPGARRESVENYLRRLEELEKIATSFEGIEKAYALSAGREIRVFVKPEKIDDLSALKLAKKIAKRIEKEMVYPGEIKVTLIREKRVVEYAR